MTLSTISQQTPPRSYTALLEKGQKTALKSAICAVKRSKKQSEAHAKDVQWLRAHCYAIQILGSLCNNSEVQQLKKELEVLQSVINK